MKTYHAKFYSIFLKKDWTFTPFLPHWARLNCFTPCNSRN